MYKQSQNDYRRLLKELIESLEISSKAYDSGYVGEAKRLATTIRVLLHDTSKSTSFFSQIGIKNKLRFFATPNPYGQKNILTECNLVKLRISKDPGYEPILDDFPPVFKWQKLRFYQWWSEKIVRDKKRATTTRKELITVMANQDGGAHVDPTLNEKYAKLSKRNGLNWVFSINKQIKEAEPGPAYACCRQIAFELLRTLQKNNKIVDRGLAKHAV